MNADCQSIKEWASAFSLVLDCEKIGDHHLRLTTPFLYPDGSNIDVFMEIYEEMLDGHKLSDLGQTSGYLADLRVNFQTHARRRRLVGGVCKTLKVTNDDGELVTWLPKKDSLPESDYQIAFSDAVARLAQACVRTSDLSFTQQFKVKSNFKATVQSFLMELPVVRVESDVKVPGRFDKLIKVDFRAARGSQAHLISTLSPQTQEGSHGLSLEVFSKWYDLERRHESFITVVDERHFVPQPSDMKRLAERSKVVSFPAQDNELAALLAQ